jgi:hypothetical protein
VAAFGINGLQQVGTGVTDFARLAAWYASLGFDRLLVEDTGPATMMACHAGGVVREKHAAVLVSLSGGGGLEIWHALSPPPKIRDVPAQLGDLGIFAVKVGLQPSGAGDGAQEDPLGRSCRWRRDPDGNVVQQIVGRSDRRHGVQGAIIGVRDVDRLLRFLRDIAGAPTVRFDGTGCFEDFAALPGGDRRVRRVIVALPERGTGSLGRFMGPTEIELVAAIDGPANPIFERRFWGDPGFIHLAFDIWGAAALKSHALQHGWHVTVDSGRGFEMGGAVAQFLYVEPEPGLLFEFVEIEALPLFAPLGIRLRLGHGKPRRPLPRGVASSLLRVIGRRIS